MISRFILSTLRTYRGTRGLDIEGLSQDIFLEAWNNHTPVTKRFIYHRFLNAIRHRNVCDVALEKCQNSSSCVYYTSDTSDDTATRIELTSILSKVELSPSDISLLFQLYYKQLSLSDYAKQIGLPEATVHERHFNLLEKLRRVVRTFN